jgi:peptide/nickel transport system substrate-binding protein
MMSMDTCTSTSRGLWTVFLVVLLAAAGCFAPARDPGTVVFASGADLESANPLVTIHPLARQVQRYVLFVTLARYDAELEPEPYLARRWEWEDNGRSLRFHLYPGLRWHDGPLTTSRDVAFTIDAARDPATGFPRAADLAGIVAVEAPDDSTVVIRFDTPQAFFPRILCELPILPEHLVGGTAPGDMRRAPFATAPVGNGPFRFVERRAGQRWIFDRNEDFPDALGGPPSINRVVVAVVDEATTKFAGLVSGELHVAGISPVMASRVARDATLRVLSYPLIFTTGIIVNTARAPFDDVRVRRAIDLSVDRQRIIDVALAGYATPAAGPVSPENPFFAGMRTGRDPARADSLLDAAGWVRGPDGHRSRGGTRFRFELLTVGSADNEVEQLLQADLAERGITLDIRRLEFAAFLAAARAAEKQFDAIITGVSGDLSLAYVAAMYDSRQAGGALDYGGYQTTQLDSLLALTRRARSEEALRESWIGVQNELSASMPAIWLYHSRGVQGLSRSLDGVTMDLRGEMVSISDWTLR